MGPRDIPSQVLAHAGVHALYVGRRRADLQHGHRIHAALEPVQEPCVHKHWYVILVFGSANPIHVSRPAFAPFAPASSSSKSLSTLPLQKIAYLVCNLLTLALGLWKCRSMGLLPTGTGDWLAFETRGQVRVSLTLTYRRSVAYGCLSLLRYYLSDCMSAAPIYTILL